MKFLLAFAALALGVSAQSTSSAASGGDSECLAEYILTRCLETETPKTEECSSNDYNCLCAAYEALSTCFNNCPSDPRAPAARQQLDSYCAQVTTSTSASASTTATSASIGIDEETSSMDRPTNTRSFSADLPDNTGGAAEGLVKNTGGMILGAAGLAALVL